MKKLPTIACLLLAIAPALPTGCARARLATGVSTFADVNRVLRDRSSIIYFTNFEYTRAVDVVVRPDTTSYRSGLLGIRSSIPTNRIRRITVRNEKDRSGVGMAVGALPGLALAGISAASLAQCPDDGSWCGIGQFLGLMAGIGGAALGSFVGGMIASSSPIIVYDGNLARYLNAWP